MGILERVKNMFTEEVDEPVKVVETKEEVEKEKVVKEEQVGSEDSVKPVKNLEKPMPIFFDEQDFATLEKPKIKEDKSVIEEKYYTKKSETTEKKAFKLSPVISPVYGVLDKNYHKEDITPKRQTTKVSSYYDKESITIDEVRKKAYGTLEDELETSLMPSKEVNDEVIGSRMQRKYRNDFVLEDLMDPDYRVDTKKEERESKLEESSKTLEPIALDDFLLHDEKEEETDYKDPLEDTLTESDLFHLIDSMYDKEEE